MRFRKKFVLSKTFLAKEPPDFYAPLSFLPIAFLRVFNCRRNVNLSCRLFSFPARKNRLPIAVAIKLQHLHFVAFHKTFKIQKIRVPYPRRRNRLRKCMFLCVKPFYFYEEKRSVRNRIIPYKKRFSGFGIIDCAVNEVDFKLVLVFAG